ncbi:MAG: toxin-antitoxin system HicB family antitoxin [Bacteroidota bacterium]
MATKQIALRFDEDLIAKLKIKAKAQHRSLNNYIEYLLFRDIGHIPNQETIEAINEAKESELEKIEDLDSWLENL